ncbi:hypothetical protein BEL04_17665 [Mucilaginibacter sp. PPCGB 2223]|uniref:hypothetical protein n=1 Tax=Mucilaginibacter sp. PPCGB 2223 TaxID=1886027 RepID=UPI0008240C65|nr:hypothetical protein [Mucilaginibacter sp. PPCGB 2223]OCX51838.1 hypothetical protein BEL04_17665 [Mucilaginibacter sp. PPCGB 2223]
MINLDVLTNRKVFFLLLLFFLTHTAIAQEAKYIVFEEKPGGGEMVTKPFKIKTTNIELSSIENSSQRMSIYNFYFSKNRFIPAGLDKEAFRESYNDYKKINNDIVVTMTPLNFSAKSNISKLSSEEVRHLDVMTPEQLLQTAIINLYQCFTEGEISRPNNATGDIKTEKIKLIIKKSNEYFLVNSPVLTEYYLVDECSYAFPTQYHYGEINTASNLYSQYFTLKDIVNFRLKYGLIDKDSKLLSNKILPMQIDSIAAIYPVIEYNTYPSKGIGSFYFLTGVGIINGSYDIFLNAELKMHHDIDILELGKMQFAPLTINGVSFKDYSKLYKKTHPFQIKGVD